MAQDGADSLTEANQQQLQDNKDKGLYSPPNGTGPLAPGAPGYKDPNGGD